MEAKNLRVGNLIYSKGTTDLNEVYHIDTDSDNRDRINYIGINDYEPIPLTKEIAQAFGFKICSYINDRYDYADFQIVFDAKGAIVFRITGRTLCACPYVHELQNLIFAIQGEEFEFNTEALEAAL